MATNQVISADSHFVEPPTESLSCMKAGIRWDWVSFPNTSTTSGVASSS
jgi:hypothetical protein